jgi:prepilin-type N-terminal cleavage/methylation domain-containing protein
MNTNRPQKNEGFTIIETLVAISILLVATTGPLTFAQSSLRASFLARDQIGAFYLAQDAIETIKNIRDNKGLLGDTPWLANIDACSPSTGVTGVCNIETAASTGVGIVQCPSNVCSPLYYDSVDRQYVLSSGPNRARSKYTRTIFITEIVPDKEAQIVVEVKWDSNFFSNKRILVQENIYNWVPKYSN